MSGAPQDCLTLTGARRRPQAADRRRTHRRHRRPAPRRGTRRLPERPQPGRAIEDGVSPDPRPLRRRLASTSSPAAGTSAPFSAHISTRSILTRSPASSSLTHEQYRARRDRVRRHRGRHLYRRTYHDLQPPTAPWTERRPASSAGASITTCSPPPALFADPVPETTRIRCDFRDVACEVYVKFLQATTTGDAVRLNLMGHANREGEIVYHAREQRLVSRRASCTGAAGPSRGQRAVGDEP